MSSQGGGQRLRGRDSERETLGDLISTVRSGTSQVLVLRGEAGVGKTALLEYVAELASGCRCVHVAGIQSDMELPFAGLQQLCAPLLDHLDELPEPQREALNVAFGRGVGETPDRFLVGLAVLSLMAAAATKNLSCVLSTTRSGSTKCRCRRSALSHGACWPSRSPSYSLSATAALTCSSAYPT